MSRWEADLWVAELTRDNIWIQGEIPANFRNDFFHARLRFRHISGSISGNADPRNRLKEQKAKSSEVAHIWVDIIIVKTPTLPSNVKRTWESSAS
jgi:hypothetical protein